MGERPPPVSHKGAIVCLIVVAHISLDFVEVAGFEPA